MIEISDKTAKEIQNLFGHFIAVTANIPRTNKNDNARRVAGKIIKYLNKKNEEKKAKTNSNPTRTTRGDSQRGGLSYKHGEELVEGGE